MRDEDCVALLRWALPRLGLRWAGFRRVRRQVCRRIDRRREQLGLETPAAYQRYLETHSSEWAQLDQLCRISISRFFRDRRLFERLGAEVLPELARSCAARGETELHAWSAGCASGEEPYSLVLVGATDIVATDVDAHLLERARAGVYAASSLKEVPESLREQAFRREGGRFRFVAPHRIRFLCQDLREEMPEGPIDLILCRYLAFTYFGAALRNKVARELAARLAPGGLLTIGRHESLPDASRWASVGPCLYRLR